MNTRQITEEYRLTHWAGIMRERQASGLSVKAFCETAGFHENVYYYWQRKLREAACGHLAEATRQSLPTPGFAEVRMEQLPLAEATQISRICLEVGRIRITTDSAYPADKLATLIRELSRPC